MDFEGNKAASSSSSHSHTAPSSASNHQTERALRSSTRLKVAREKEREKEKDESAVEQVLKRGRDNLKGKAKETSAESPSGRTTKRARRATLAPTATGLIINEPAKDLKGKKRAAPESVSEDESSRPTAKRLRSSGAYSLRSKKDAIVNSTMPKKTRTPVKGKSVAKSKTIAMPGPSRHEEDEEMMDVDFNMDMHEEDEDDSEQEDEEHHQDSSDKSDEDQPEEQEKPIPPPPAESTAEARRSLEETMAMFDFGRLGGYMNQLNARLRQLLNNIKPSVDPTTKLVALQELSELLSISTEDTLAGSFNVENFVRELVRILGGTGGEAAQEEGDDDDEEHNDEDAALAAALSLSAGGTLAGGDENLEAQLLACRCLANLMEALPGSGHTLVYHGAIPVLCSKLIEISYIDLAEQTLITLEKISEEYPSAIVREGGLAALLNYLDFFSIAVQRTALQAAANCCRNASGDSFPMIKGVWPTIRNCLGYADQRLVDYAVLCVIRVIESYHRSHVEKLEALVDVDLIRAVNALLLPAGGSPLIPTGTFTLLLRGLATAARASPTIAISLLEADIVTTVYQILTGVLPPAIDDSEEQGNSATGQGLGGGLADMTVMQNLAHRPKEQVEEALTLVSELLPPLPKDGTFDQRAYTEKALHRMMKAKAKADRAAARASAAAAVASLPGGRSPASSRAQTPTASTPGGDDDAVGPPMPPNDVNNALPTLPTIVPPQSTEQAVDRTELLKQHSKVVNRFIRLILPILVDVYAASVSISVRIKCLASLLKAICFQDADQLTLTLKNVPIASFASSVLSSKDHTNLMIGALQMVELLLSKSPEEHKSAFKREGVLHEIETLASRTLPPKMKEKEQPEVTDASEGTGPNPPSTRRTLTIDPEDTYTLRARVIRFKYLLNDMYSEGDATYSRLQRLVYELKQPMASEEQLREALRELASLFASTHTTVSSFELLQSGLVDALLDFASSNCSGVNARRRQQLLIQELAPYKFGKPSLGPSPLGILVKKLQESLTRMETFEVTTVSPGLEDTKRNSPSLLARQIRLRLIAEEGSDTLRLGSGNNIVVSIHAIATFQALNDYLRPRLSGMLSSSRFSSMLAALASGRASAEALFSGGLLDPPKQPETQPTSGSANGSSAQEAKPERRRSMRLSAKASSSSLTEKPSRELPGPSVAPPSVASTATVTSASNVAVKEAIRGAGVADGAGSETVINEEDDDNSADYMGEDLDAEVFEEDMDHDEDAVAEKTVTLSVVDDGSKVVAQTPDGTRVATPSPNSAPGPSVPESNASPPKPSYAAALKNKHSDWQLEFSMDDHVLPLDMTIYGAVHQSESRKASGGAVQTNVIWQNVYTVKYKKVTGPRQPPETRPEAVEPPSRARSPVPTLTSLSDEASHSKILKLLRSLHKLNNEIPDSDISNAQPLPETAFINNKLTAKLTRQLEEPMIVASSCLPDWAMDLPLHFPFLFPFSTRFSFLQSTSFGYARLILKWQSQNRAQESSRRDDTFGFLGRLQRQKVRISRKHILESAFKVFELYGSSSSILEVEYFDEVGTGLGPTLEFYSLVSKEFARRDLKIWRDADSMYPGNYVHHPTGLFPAPVDPDSASTEAGEKRTYVFRIVGQFIAKALLDSRIIDMSFNKIFLKMVLGEEVPLTITSLRHIDPTLANSLTKLQSMAHPPEDDTVSMLASIEDLMLDFTLPGYDLELRPGGKDVSVTKNNVDSYIDAVIDASIGKGVALQAKAFREGFSKVFPVTDLQAFSAEELGVLFGNADEDWSVETLTEAMKADHGFNVESPAIRDLVVVMSNYDKPTRRNFLQFITGSPKLPIGGFRGLNPPLTVVRKPHEAPLTADDYLPSVMTCVNYLKLPQYSSKTVMREKLEVAMKEGVGSFHLS